MSLERELEGLRGDFDEILERFTSLEVVLTQLAMDGADAGGMDFDIEQTRVADLHRCRKAVECRAARLVIAIGEETQGLSAKFSQAQSYTGYENFVSIVSRRRAAVLQRARMRHVPFAKDLEGLLSISETAMDLLKEHRHALRQGYVAVEEELAVLVGQCREMRKRDEPVDGAKGQESKDRYAQSMRYAALFQNFADALNAQIAGLNTLINKLAIDTEQRVVLYRALPDAARLAPDQNPLLPARHGENTTGGHIAELLVLYEKKLRTPQDIERRQRLADEAFSRRFRGLPESAA